MKNAKPSAFNKIMNTTKLELPDGRLVTLEGSCTAQDIAQFINREYLAAPPAAPFQNCESEEPLEIPQMNFEKPTQADVPLTVNAPVGEEEPLPLPCMKFHD
jgi:hypothetical protein